MARRVRPKGCRRTSAGSVPSKHRLNIDWQTSQRADQEQADQEQADTDRYEKEHVANLPRMAVNFISPLSATKLEFSVEEAAEKALEIETVAPHYGLEKSDTQWVVPHYAYAPLLQLGFSETLLTLNCKQNWGQQECATSPMQCRVRGVQSALVLKTRKAGKLFTQGESNDARPNRPS